MRTLLHRLFIENWLRKLISLVVAVIIWMVVNNSLTVTKTVHNIPIRVVNLAHGQTIEGMQVNGYLNKRISLAVTGNRSIMNNLTGKDMVVQIDGQGKSDEWIATITKKELASLNPDIDVTTMISRVAAHSVVITPSKLVSEKIPILITQPIGEAPKGYQYLDVWPYQLYLTVTGPEKTVKKLKAGGHKLTFNLHDINRSDLDALAASNKQGQTDEVSFFVPINWKKVNIPSLSETPLEIDDPQAKSLRIDFLRQELIPLSGSIPVTIFFPPKYSSTLNPETYTLATNEFIVKKSGIKVIAPQLYAQGVSRLFVETVKDMIQIVVVAVPKSERDTLLWNAQFIYPHELEDRYVAKVMSESRNEFSDVQPRFREEVLRNRFRSYMNRFRLYTPQNKKLSLKIELQANSINITPQNLIALEKKEQNEPQR